MAVSEYQKRKGGDDEVEGDEFEVEDAGVVDAAGAVDAVDVVDVVGAVGAADVVDAVDAVVGAAVDAFAVTFAAVDYGELPEVVLALDFVALIIH